MSFAQQAEDPNPQYQRLQEIFEHSNSKFERSSAATRLWIDGYHEPEYLQFLLDNAWEAVLDDAPRVWKTDEQGEIVRGELSEEFEAWADERELDPMIAAGKRRWEMPGALTALAATGAPEAVDVLERGLESPNPIVVAISVSYLARMQVERVLPRLKQLATEDDSDFTRGLALKLLYYDDPEAHAIAESVVDNPELLESARAEIDFEREARSEQ